MYMFDAFLFGVLETAFSKVQKDHMTICMKLCVIVEC
jgi:hypothetical protein